MTSKYVVATIHEWNFRAFAEKRDSLSGEWHLIAHPKDLNENTLETINPRYIFFPHWSWIVPECIFSKYESVLFHMTDLPYGRGGSPLQNLIIRGHKETLISAVRMEKSLDSGPIYMKRPLSLHGSAQEIFERASRIIFDMIDDIVRDEPVPVPQEGEPTYFKRRTPEMSQLPERADSIERIYDHIRMLDATGYPKAFLEKEDYRIEFEEASLHGEIMEARARFIIKKKNDG